MQTYVGVLHVCIYNRSLSERALAEAQEDGRVLTREVGQQDYGGRVYKQDVTILMDCCEATGWSCLDCLGMGWWEGVPSIPT